MAQLPGGKFEEGQKQGQTYDYLNLNLSLQALLSMFSYIYEKLQNQDSLQEVLNIKSKLSDFQLNVDLQKDQDGNINGSYTIGGQQGNLKIEKLQTLDDILNEINGLSWKDKRSIVRLMVIDKDGKKYLGVFYGNLNNDLTDLNGNPIDLNNYDKIKINTESGNTKSSVNSVEYKRVNLDHVKTMLEKIFRKKIPKIRNQPNSNMKSLLEDILQKYSGKTYLVSNDNQGYLEVILKNANDPNGPDAKLRGRFLLIDLGKKEIKEDEGKDNGKKKGFWSKVKNFFKKVGNYLYKGFMYIGLRIAIAMDKREIIDCVNNKSKIPQGAINAYTSNVRKYLSLFKEDHHGYIDWLEDVGKVYASYYQNAIEPAPSPWGMYAFPTVASTILTGWWPFLILTPILVYTTNKIVGKVDTPGADPKYIENKVKELRNYLNSLKSQK